MPLRADWEAAFESLQSEGWITEEQYLLEEIAFYETISNRGQVALPPLLVPPALWS